MPKHSKKTDDRRAAVFCRTRKCPMLGGMCRRTRWWLGRFQMCPAGAARADLSASTARPATTPIPSTKKTLRTRGSRARQKRRRAEDGNVKEVHELLSMAKAGKWLEIEKTLKRNPRLIDLRPEGRKYALIHFAAYQLHENALDILLRLGADTSVKSQDGETEHVPPVGRSSETNIDPRVCTMQPTGSQH
eukprot:g1739.t1